MKYWAGGGPNGVVYDATKKGWFDKRRMKSKHLGSGFHATGIYRMNRNKVIKGLVKIESDQDLNFKALTDSVLQLIKEKTENIE